jgi:hypothetical protein
MYAATENPLTRGLAFHRAMNVEIARPVVTKTGSVRSRVALFVAASAMGAGGWFGYLAWSLDSFPHGAAAVVLLLAAPALAVAAILARNITAAADTSTSPLELLERLRRLDASLRAVQLARAHIYVGASYAAVLGICESTGLISSREFVLFYAGAILVAAACYLPWTTRQEARMQDQRATCRELLAERKAARAWVIE